ncbi:MAG: flagellar export chaperone FliS [Gammaproteobacteria bacterium]|nr:flagellar export chaperone FliS [Gammaproteobacteria bacterium]MDH5728325.1 flagellar export chaperone FliS [Gammaproteobacteria bacterium]
MNKSALQQYTSASKQAEVAYASPHTLILLLMEGALEKIAVAKGCMQRQEIAEKGSMIGWAISIIDGLRMSLDMDAGGEIAENLDNLYDYMTRQLVLGHARNDEAKLDEVAGLMKTIKSGWEGIADQVNNQEESEPVQK